MQDVNATQVAEGEILSDQVYGYDAKTHKLSICAPGKELKQEQGKNILQEPAMGVMEGKTAYETKKRRNRFMSRSSTVEEAGNKRTEVYMSEQMKRASRFILWKN